jgi:hypothetical protein
MKKIIFLLFISVFVVCSCDKYEYPDSELTVNDLYTFCETDGKLPCNELLNHEGDFVTVIGYYRISSHEDYVNGNKFRFFDTPAIGSINTEITITENSKSVFDKITNFINANSTEEYIKLKVSGKIVGHDLPTNNSCSRGVFLEVDSSSAIRND